MILQKTVLHKARREHDCHETAMIAMFVALDKTSLLAVHFFMCAVPKVYMKLQMSL